jgi:hypothetical protein
MWTLLFLFWLVGAILAWMFMAGASILNERYDDETARRWRNEIPDDLSESE